MRKKLKDNGFETCRGSRKKGKKCARSLDNMEEKKREERGTEVGEEENQRKDSAQ